MNTSLVSVNYPLETVQLTFTDFNEFLKGDVKNVTKTFKMHNVNWYAVFETESVIVNLTDPAGS